MFSQYGDFFGSTSKENDKIGLISTERKNDIFEQVARKIGKTALKEHDDSIISVGFGQFVTEGKIDLSLKLLTEKAIQRQLLPIVLDQIEEKEYQNKRKDDLEIMLNDLKKNVITSINY